LIQSEYESLCYKTFISDVVIWWNILVFLIPFPITF
jgi:hypothetical protein